MKTIRYEGGAPVELYHSVKACQRDFGDMVEVRELAEDHPDVLALRKKQKDRMKPSKAAQALAALTPAQIDAAGPDKLKEILKTMLANMRSN